MHRAGASALTQLLQFEQPDAEHLTVPCACGGTARFKEMRAKSFSDRESVFASKNSRLPDHVTALLSNSALDRSLFGSLFQSTHAVFMVVHSRLRMISVSRASTNQPASDPRAIRLTATPYRHSLGALPLSMLTFISFTLRNGAGRCDIFSTGIGDRGHMDPYRRRTRPTVCFMRRGCPSATVAR
jgi:hypothetical protein